MGTQGNIYFSKLFSYFWILWFLVISLGLFVLFLGFEVNAIDLICLLLFIGAMGKSAQILLHTWLPDAMEGPTPVSALIHAATMVTAGVFLVVRCSPIYEYSPLILNLITIVGMTTAFIYTKRIIHTVSHIKGLIRPPFG